MAIRITSKPQTITDELGTGRGTQMAKTLFAIGAAGFIVASVAGWAAIPTSQARVAQAETVQVNTFEMMETTKQMPSEHFVDFSFVY